MISFFLNWLIKIELNLNVNSNAYKYILILEYQDMTMFDQYTNCPDFKNDCNQVDTYSDCPRTCGLFKGQSFKNNYIFF